MGRRVDGQSERALWIEVRPASSVHVEQIVRKARCLRSWLADWARALRAITDPSEPLIWISTGPVTLQRSTPRSRRLTLEGVRFPVAHLRI